MARITELGLHSQGLLQNGPVPLHRREVSDSHGRLHRRSEAAQRTPKANCACAPAGDGREKHDGHSRPTAPALQPEVGRAAKHDGHPKPSAPALQPAEGGKSTTNTRGQLRLRSSRRRAGKARRIANANCACALVRSGQAGN
eukprot:g38904.t1